MSEDQQLTVAELLARAQKDNPDAGKRRRRRRSLEEGGVSVAELTGSLKRVDARPPEPKHSSVPIDPPEEQAKEKASGAASAPREVEVEKVEVKRPEQSAAADSAAPAESAESSAPSADETAVLPKVGPGVSRPVKIAPEKSAAADSAAPAAPKQSATADSADSATPEVTEVAEDADDSINPIMLVLLVFFGLILGVLGFLAFQWIWANAATAVAVIAGIVAVVAVIFGVKALRTGNDALTVTMAGIAAAVMAFGPALI